MASWYSPSSLVHAAGNVIAPTAEAFGAVTSLGGKVDNPLAYQATQFGHNISNPNVTLTNPEALSLNISPKGNGKAFSGAGSYGGGMAYVSSDTGGSGGSGDGSGGAGGDGRVYGGGRGIYTNSSSGGTTPDYSAQIASLDAQANALKNNLGYADTQLGSGLGNLLAQYNQQKSGANTNHSRALQDFQTTEQNDNLGHQQAIDQVNTHARTLANSVRQMIGNASGSGSSAYQITAPGAVQRQADMQSQGINSDFGQNMNALKTSKDREAQDYNNLLTTLDDKYNHGVNDFKTSIEQQKQQINGQLADIAAQRAAYLGGGVSGAQAAANPYQANATANQQAIDALAKQYASPFTSVKPVSVAKPTLRDYVTGGQTNVATDQAGTQTTDTPTYNPLATWLKNQDQNQYAF